ncbi:unnamed protein product, partial [Prorocentrum cordatum]
GVLALRCIVDSADEPDCLALRADIMGICQHADSKIGGKFHSLATTSKKQPRVKRDTFSAGARAVGDAASMCTVFARLIQEMDMEPSSCATLADAQIGE